VQVTVAQKQPQAVSIFWRFMEKTDDYFVERKNGPRLRQAVVLS
jgi:hypothetical protein